MNSVVPSLPAVPPNSTDLPRNASYASAERLRAGGSGEGELLCQSLPLNSQVNGVANPPPTITTFDRNASNAMVRVDRAGGIVAVLLAAQVFAVRSNSQVSLCDPP